MNGERVGRRIFLQNAVGFFGLPSLPLFAQETSPPTVEYVALLSSIDVHTKKARRRTKVQTLPSKRPRSLTVDGSRKFLFAVNDVDDFHGLPTGSVESYNIDPDKGHLSLICRMPLSLSATRPRHLAISPDSRHMVVSAYGGGLYNLISIDGNGNLGLVQAVKEIGSSIHPDRQSCAHPHSAVFDPTGRFVIGTDQGADRVNVFRIEHGLMVRAGRIQSPAGSGPGPVSLDSTGANVRIEHEFGGYVSQYCFDCETGDLSNERRIARSVRKRAKLTS